MKNLADVLNEKILKMKSPIVVGLDPVLKEIPNCYQEKYSEEKDRFKAIGDILFDFNKDIIDAICDMVPAVKPQIAFYEMYGSQGLLAFERTVKYAKSKGLVVIGDGKRNDIGNTATAYAKGHLGKVDVGNSKEEESINVDFLTVSPYLGADTLDPFVKECIQSNKGIFILVKTSNPLSGYIQDIANEDGIKVYEMIAKYVAEQAEKLVGEGGYSPIGAVVGATYPEQAVELRKIMPKSIFLVPGYGAQGATAKDICNCFNKDGLGAIVNSSRGIIFAYKNKYTKEECTKEQHIKTVKEATESMRISIIEVLTAEGKILE